MHKLSPTVGGESTENIQHALAEFFRSTAVGAARWIHHGESGLSLDEFQALRALAEKFQLDGRVEILETHHETETRRRLADAIRLRRLA